MNLTVYMIHYSKCLNLITELEGQLDLEQKLFSVRVESAKYFSTCGQQTLISLSLD